MSRSNTTGYKRVRLFSLPAETIRHIWLPPRLSAISCFLARIPSTKDGFLSRRVCACDSASFRDSRQELKEQSLQEAIYRAQQSRQETRDRGSLGGSQYDGQSLQEA